MLEAQQSAPKSEKTTWKNKKAQKDSQGLYRLNDKPILPKSLYKWAAKLSHGLTHVSTGGMYTMIDKHYSTIGLHKYLQSFCKQCVICLKHNPQGNIKQPPGSFPKPEYPFQHLCMDFIELNPCENKRYCLVLIDPFSKWTEAVPVKHNDAETVAKILLERIIPTFGIPQRLYSDNGTHFVNQIIDRLARQFDIELKNHCAYHPQSAGLVERTNGTIKQKLKKVMEQTGNNWMKCLPLVMFYMRITPNKTGLTPFEVVHGRPFVLPTNQAQDSGERDLIDYMRLTLQSRNVQNCNFIPDTPVSDPTTPGPLLKVGDWIFIKAVKRKRWHQPRWEGPFQVVLTTPTAVKIQERSTWVHNTHCKLAPEHLEVGTDVPTESSD